MGLRKFNAAWFGKAAAAFAACSAQVAAATQPDQLICGFTNVEDLVAIPGSPWIVGSGIGDRFFQGGALHLINEDTNLVRKLDLAPMAGKKPQRPYDQCPGPVAAEKFSAHGLSLAENPDGSHNLLVVNHGGRESIEVFKVTPGDGEPGFDWIGCVLTPETSMSNSVAARPDGSMVMSASAVSDEPIPQFHEIAASGTNSFQQDAEEDGGISGTGALFEWSRKAGWREIAGSRLPGNNGVELSRDGQWAYSDAYGAGSVVKLPFRPGLGEAQEVKLGFNPDNIRWSHDGKLVATGHTADMADMAACFFSNDPNCRIDYRVAEIDPATMEVTQLFDGTATPLFGFATVGLKTAKALWLGSVQSECIGRVALTSDE